MIGFTAVVPTHGDNGALLVDFNRILLNKLKAGQAAKQAADLAHRDSKLRVSPVVVGDPNAKVVNVYGGTKWYLVY
jgi:hypothetical protein